MLVGLATQTSIKHTNKCVDGSTHCRIKVAKTIVPTLCMCAKTYLFGRNV